MVRIALVADLHFGRIRKPSLPAALVRAIHQSGAHGTIVAGDITQRARLREFKAYSAWSNALQVPQLLIAGNHDVYPWWFVWARLIRPLGRFFVQTGAPARPTVQWDSVRVRGEQTATGRTIQAGRWSAPPPSQPPRVAPWEVLALHHPPFPHAANRHQVIPGADRPLRSYEIDVCVGGHLHIPMVSVFNQGREDGHRPILLVQTGTCLSDRGRGAFAGRNCYHDLLFNEHTVQVTQYHYRDEIDQFTPAQRWTYDRPTGTLRADDD